MKLFIDTADVGQIKEAWNWGIIDGVTTNPSHVAKAGRKPEDVYKEICDIVDGPVSLEAVSLEADDIVKEGKELARIHKNVVIKVPIIKEGLKAVKRLAAEGYKTNVTVTFSALQALLAAKVGATYISPFVGRLDAVGHDGTELVRQIKTIYRNYGYQTQIITAAVRHPIHVLQAALAGADVVTAAYDTIEQLYHHPLTDAAMKTFLDDWAKLKAAKL
jgi:transaldolase